MMNKGKSKARLWTWVMACALVLSWGVLCSADFYVIPIKPKNPAPVPMTGQTPTVPIPAPAGSDGELQKGVTWPNPRLTDNGNGTVTDNLTGLIWLQTANCDGIKNWADALTWSNALASGSCSLTDSSSAGDWRLPNVRELHSLIDFAYIWPALSDAAGTAIWSEGDAFSGVVSSYYWSSTTYAVVTGSAWGVGLDDGFVTSASKTGSYYVWPVRGGQ